MNNQFSTKISEVLNHSKAEAQRLHNSCVEPEHLLLGLLKEGEGKAVQILRLLNLDFNAVRLRVEQTAQTRLSEGASEENEIILSEKAAKIMRLCLLEARMLKADVADTEHILLAIMKEKENNACRILEEHSIHYTDILNLLTQKREKSDVQSGFGFPDEIRGTSVQRPAHLHEIVITGSFRFIFPEFHAHHGAQESASVFPCDGKVIGGLAFCIGNFNRCTVCHVRTGAEVMGE